MTTTGISVCIIGHNEAANIRRCLQSVQGLADEIILVVNDCTDATDKIAAEEFGAKVFYESWHGFGDQKNLALDRAQGTWILCLDCDEVVSAELAQEILGFVRTAAADCNGAQFPRKVWFLGRWITHGDWYPDVSLRLIRRGKGRWSRDAVHERMLLEGRAERLHADLLHYSNPTLNVQISKINSFSDSYLRAQLDKGKKWSLSQTLLRPPWRFFRAYVLRGGFLDGFPGLYVAVLTAFAAFVRHSRMYEYNTTEEVRAKFSPAASGQDTGSKQ